MPGTAALSIDVRFFSSHLTGHHVNLFSPLDSIHFSMHIGRKVGTALDTATAAWSTSAEFAEGAERITREGVVAVIGP